MGRCGGDRPASAAARRARPSGSERQVGQVLGRRRRVDDAGARADQGGQAGGLGPAGAVGVEQQDDLAGVAQDGQFVRTQAEPAQRRARAGPSPGRPGSRSRPRRRSRRRWPAARSSPSARRGARMPRYFGRRGWSGPIARPISQTQRPARTSGTTTRPASRSRPRSSSRPSATSSAVVPAVLGRQRPQPVALAPADQRRAEHGVGHAAAAQVGQRRVGPPDAVGLAQAGAGGRVERRRDRQVGVEGAGGGQVVGVGARHGGQDRLLALGQRRLGVAGERARRRAEVAAGQPRDRLAEGAAARGP